MTGFRKILSLDIKHNYEFKNLNWSNSKQNSRKKICDNIFVEKNIKNVLFLRIK